MSSDHVSTRSWPGEGLYPGHGALLNPSAGIAASSEHRPTDEQQAVRSAHPGHGTELFIAVLRVATPAEEDDDESVLNLVRSGVVVVAIGLTACAEVPSADTASQTSTSLAIQRGNPTTTTGTQEAQVMRRVGQSFILGDVQLTVLSVQDPFSSTAQLQPAAGRRLVSVKYEVVSQSSTSQDLSALPTVELRDSTGAATSRSMAG